MKLSSKSVWFRLASVYGRLDTYYDDTTDICTMIRHQMYGVFIILFFLTLSTVFLLGPLADILAMLLVWIQTGYRLELGWGFLLVPLVAAVGAIGVCFAGMVLLGQHKPKAPAFLSEAYRGFKEKTCVLVTIE